ncbi:ferritin-like domain-containing protein [Vreelandella populi]|uniref:Ferritin-like domain-containing protein n=1 Tax=Vreelandella populi TaxID=2498858 RepID=A0A433L953_9GAMM|nr:ferritin-like domain-containing protein [Halomonas populi]RUR37008.1 ferritin-like domain-containing protein [Halomonas populi]RUR44021.1 ferritin-like domain-containing protein [Halomonas populi]
METKYLENWLRDAHAMEQQAEKMLKSQAERLVDYPELQARIEQHLNETRHQSDRLEQAMAGIDIDTSALKDLGGKLTAFGQAMGGMMAGDEVMKGSIACYAFEHFEIANYKALIQAAESAGQTGVAQVCREILKEEEAMAAWLSDHLESTTTQFLHRADDDNLRAKR